MRGRVVLLSIVLCLFQSRAHAFDTVFNHIAFQDPNLSVSILCGFSYSPPLPTASCSLPWAFDGVTNDLLLGTRIYAAGTLPPHDDTGKLSNTGILDALGRMYIIGGVQNNDGSCCKQGVVRVEADGSITPLIVFEMSYPGYLNRQPYLSGLHLDLVNGVMFVNAIYPSSQIAYCSQGSCAEGSQTAEWEVIKITGLPTLLDIILSYQPPSTLSFNVPVRPEGLPGADSFSVYAGNVRTASDLSQASALQCTVPAGRPPVPGEQLTVPDMLPDPAEGDARYYLAAVNYQGQRRAGRSAINGVSQGRDAAALPGCQ